MPQLLKLKYYLRPILYGILTALGISLLLLILFIGVIRLIGSINNNFILFNSLIVFQWTLRLILFGIPFIIFYVGTIMTWGNVMNTKRIYWLSGAIVELLLLFFMQLNFGM